MIDRLGYTITKKKIIIECILWKHKDNNKKYNKKNGNSVIMNDRRSFAILTKKNKRDKRNM